MSRYTDDTGFVLGRRDFGEYDRIIRLFTLEQGRVDAVARGARKPSSKLASRLEPFSEVKWRFVQSHGLPIIIGADIVQAGPDTLSITSLWRAHGLLELTERSFSESEHDSSWYYFLQSGLAATFDTAGEVVWLSALARSLDQLGLTPTLPQSDEITYINVAQGTFSPHSGTHQLTRRSLHLWQVARTHPVDTLRRISHAESEIRELTDLLEEFWQYHTGQTLRSRQLA